MEQWRKNLIVLWFGQFLVMSGMTMIMPFLALYLQTDLGLSDPHEIGIWAGVIFASNFVTAFLFQPIWGKLSDKYGRKLMLLRSGFGMAIVMCLMGFATAPIHLLLLRLLNGVISGFNPASVALVSATTPRPKLGFAMGILQSGGIAGTILGPLIGGILADSIGYRFIFYITGGAIFVATMLVLFIVKESFDREKAAAKPQITVIAGLKQIVVVPQITALFMITLLIQFANMSPMSLIPLYIQELNPDLINLAFYAGLVSSATGLSNMLASPVLGKIGDKIGAEKILLLSLLGAALSFIPQALATDVWHLLIARFCLGLFLGGLVPTVNALLGKHSPRGMETRTYSFNSSFISLGNVIAPIAGGVLSGWIGINGLFYVSAVLMLLNGIWAWFSLVHSRQQRTNSTQ